MAWWHKFGRGRRRRLVRTEAERPLAIRLGEFVTAERGVEMYLEPATTLSQASLVLVAHDGRWHRFTVPDEAAARTYARAHHLPCYDAAVVGYPQRMRDYKGRGRTA